MLVSEKLICRFDVVELDRWVTSGRVPWRSEPNDNHEPAHAFLSARAESGHDIVVTQARDKCIEPTPKVAGVNAKRRQCPTGPQGTQRRFECLLATQGLDCDDGCRSLDPLRHKLAPAWPSFIGRLEFDFGALLHLMGDRSGLLTGAGDA